MDDAQAVANYAQPGSVKGRK